MSILLFEFNAQKVCFLVDVFESWVRWFMVLTFIIIVIVVGNSSYKFTNVFYTFYPFSKIASEWRFAWVDVVC